MKILKFVTRPAWPVAAGVLLAGCLLRPAKIATRQFILTPAIAAAPAASHGRISLGLAAIKMPDFLLRSAMAVRKGQNEVEYFEDALWAERLDRNFQRVLAADLQSRLQGSRVQLSAWLPGEVSAALFITVSRFDVDSTGQATLAAAWRVQSPDGQKTLKAGAFNLEKASSQSPPAPETIAATLSALVAEFAAKLAPELRQLQP